MTARLYPQAFADLQSGALDWEALSIKAILLSEGFVYDSTVIMRDELNDAFVIAESSVMTNPTRNGDVVTGDPIEWLQLTDTKVVKKIVLFDDTGDDAYSQLVAFFDTEDVDGLPYTVNGQNYYLYPVTPPGGFFSYGDYADIIGPVNTYSLAYSLPLGASIGGSIYAMPVLIFGLNLDVRERVCLLPDALDTDECGPPTIRSSLCG